MPNVGNDWTVVRVKDVSGGFVTDPDWVATNNIASWRATNPQRYAPNYSRNNTGHLEMTISFYDDASNSLPPIITSRVDVQAIELVEAQNVPDYLVNAGGLRQISADTVFSSPLHESPFPGFIGYRITTVQNIPAVNFIAVLARLV